MEDIEDLSGGKKPNVSLKLVPPLGLDDFSDHKDEIDAFIRWIIRHEINSREEFDEHYKKYCDVVTKSSIISVPYSVILYYYYHLVNDNLVEFDPKWEYILRITQGRSQSGVTVVSVMMRALGSCKYRCRMCPVGNDYSYEDLEDNIYPKSYRTGTTIRRGLRHDFDAVGQVHGRLNSYVARGHPVDKLEVIVLGGTFHSYDIEYRKDFIAHLYYAANIYNPYGKNSNRPFTSLEEEMKINETSLVRVIGLTIETRPDNITKKTVRELRYYGVTRVQMGLQHIDDAVLRRIDREHTFKHFLNANKLLVDNGFKVDIHIMYDLPAPYKKEVEEWLLDQKRQKRDSMLNDLVNGIWDSIPEIEDYIQRKIDRLTRNNNNAMINHLTVELNVRDEAEEMIKKNPFKYPPVEMHLRQFVDDLVMNHINPSDIDYSIPMYERDRHMMHTIIEMNLGDQWKLYPTAAVDDTMLVPWIEKKLYIPYCEKIITDNVSIWIAFVRFMFFLLMALLCFMRIEWTPDISWLDKDPTKGMSEKRKKKYLKKYKYTHNNVFHLTVESLLMVPPWVRINRIARDIENQFIDGANDCVNLGQLARERVQEMGKISMDISSREIRGKKMDSDDIKLVVRPYRSAEGQEYFISYESKDNRTIYGFLRLRIPDKDTNRTFFEELEDSALIRELHVYGQAEIIGSTNNKTQHRGLGRKMIKIAEYITQYSDLNKIGVIAGVGTREYYRKHGYETEEFFMTKILHNDLGDPLGYDMRDLTSKDRYNIRYYTALKLYDESLSYSMQFLYGMLH